MGMKVEAAGLLEPCHWAQDRGFGVETGLRV